MTFVVDASVVIKWFVQENHYEEALDLLDRQVLLHAPDLIVMEITNVAWKKAIRNDIEWSQAHEIASAIRKGVPALYPSVELNERALAIARALGHPVYDCLYLACAEAVEGILITADQRLRRAALDTPYDTLVRHLAGTRP